MVDWIGGFNAVLKTISQILTAGIAITAFALLLYSLTFNLKDKVARTFALIMVCLVVVFSTESFGGTSANTQMIDFWLRVQWVGIILLPATYLHFSNALLATTGHPSRWRRRWAVRLTYLFSLVLIFLLTTPWFLGPLIINQPPAPHHQLTFVTELFTLYYIFIMVLAWINFIRAVRRTVTKTSKRRMIYLTTSALAPAIGSFPFLLYGSEFASSQTTLFWLLAIIVNLALGGFIFIMAYSVAFFGIPWPDRVVKSRLLKWVLRGPVTASLALAITTLVRRGGEAFGSSYNAFVPISMIVTVLISEYAITLFYSYIERWFLFGKDSQDLDLIRSLEERIITRGDLNQFAEMILAAICDRMQAPGAFLTALTNEGMVLVTTTGNTNISEEQVELLENISLPADDEYEFFPWENFFIHPLRNEFNGSSNEILGYLGITGITDITKIDPGEKEALKRLSSRAALALRDREMQEQVFETLEKMNPQEEFIQKIRAAGRFDKQGVLVEQDAPSQKEISRWVKNALTQYWGGPKLTDNPLMKMNIVQDLLKDADQNPANALRSVLKGAIEKIRPEGERKFTGEWILYNILELKFLEGKKVREIALKLSISEADLYRKQRVAIETMADTLAQMENKKNENQTEG